MSNRNSNDDRTTHLIRKIARGWSAVIIAITLLVTVVHVVAPDTNATGYARIELLLPMLMILSVAGLAIAWRWEGLGGILNLLLFLCMIGLYRVLKGRPFPPRGLAVFSLAIIPGILFLTCWWRTRGRTPLPGS